MEIQVIEPKKELIQRLRACAYCRVSTEEDEQANSLENQITHYEEEIRSHSDYEFAGIFHDFGISGFKENRPGFQQMLQAARNHEFDLIITKSVSRFCRNTDTLLKAVRELKELGIGVFFELQDINTLSESGELMLTVLAAFAQAESENYRSLAQMVYRRKFEAGTPVQHLERCFGYTINDNGEYVPEPNESPWVRKIFELYAEGYNFSQIARYLDKNGIKAAKGGRFTKQTVRHILECEIYKGDYIMHKNYVDDDRRERENKGQADAWYIKDDHIPLVSQKLWDVTRKRLEERREYLATGSVVGERTEETYPYMNQIFCAECGYRLIRRVYSKGNRVCWTCAGKDRYLKKFCTGINVPDSVIRNWGELPGNIYIRKETDELGKTTFKYVRESTWERTNKKKDPPQIEHAPELNLENYPYKDHLFCAECGAKLSRYIRKDQRTVWFCNTRRKKGQGACKGLRVPDEVIRSWGEIKHDIYIKGEGKNHGKRSYSYSRHKSSKNKGNAQ